MFTYHQSAHGCFQVPSSRIWKGMLWSDWLVNNIFIYTSSWPPEHKHHTILSFLKGLSTELCMNKAGWEEQMEEMRREKCVHSQTQLSQSLSIPVQWRLTRWWYNLSPAHGPTEKNTLISVSKHSAQRIAENSVIWFFQDWPIKSSFVWFLTRSPVCHGSIQERAPRPLEKGSVTRVHGSWIMWQPNQWTLIEF